MINKRYFLLVALCNVVLVCADTGAIPGAIRSYCDIKWRIFHSCDSGRYEEYCIEDTLELFKSKYYDHDLYHTVFIGIPFRNYVTHENVRSVVEALASRCLFNIVVFDNSIHTNQPRWIKYLTGVLQVYDDSKRYAEELNKAMTIGLLSSKSIIAIGFSLGAQIVGQVCRGLHQKCSYLYAVDAAGPFYVPPKLLPTGLDRFQLVSTNDACEVISLSCNAGFLGTLFRRAHVNIIVNNGVRQPKCLVPGCSHVFCNQLLVDAIRRPNACLARRCSGYVSFLRGKCDQEQVFDLTFPPKASYSSCEDKTEKEYYIKTSKSPVCIGIKGI